jgi:hypothetical protein
MRLTTNQRGETEIPNTSLAILAAIVAIIPALVTSCTEFVVKPLTQKNAMTIEQRKLELEERKAAADMYRKVLASPDAVQRQKLVRFLIEARVLEEEGNNISSLPAEQIPQWPATPAMAP